VTEALPWSSPHWRIAEWLNTTAPTDLEAQRGHVVVACAFQMLCPGCVSHAIPQLKEVHELSQRRAIIPYAALIDTANGEASLTQGLGDVRHPAQDVVQVGTSRSISSAVVTSTLALTFRRVWFIF